MKVSELLSDLNVSFAYARSSDGIFCIVGENGELVGDRVFAYRDKDILDSVADQVTDYNQFCDCFDPEFDRALAIVVSKQRGFRLLEDGTCNPVLSDDEHDALAGDCLLVEPDDEYEADEFWHDLREKFPLTAQKIERDNRAVVIPSTWNAIQNIPGFSGGPEYAKNALRVVTIE